MINRICLYLFLAVLGMACSSSKQNQAKGEPVDEFRGNHVSIRDLPPVLIYKTKQDYSRNVPVIMNPDKSLIVSYPAPTDLCPGGQCKYPTPLADGFWLDNRGIGKNVAFLSYTYEEYAAMSVPPSVEVMMNQIIDRNPLTALYHCGLKNTFTHTVEELNELIKSGAYKEKQDLLK
ncbi:hypothetical protein [Parabacteroides sp. PF5-9]|uniref:hypothetical protein n=1 Tax=Parabacteroides sp. PF5-9 TaxID=1742404 RepID=UPI002477267E|nr:hypothetical protein [Parabacteroides sp. PF5-9]MDH6356851.1 hypothetical protein [Parabacteroides sp. PF5-9]